MDSGHFEIFVASEIASGVAHLFDPHSEEDMMRAIRQLIEDEDMRSRFSRAVLERASSYTWAETARLTVESYMRALDAST